MRDSRGWVVPVLILLAIGCGGGIREDPLLQLSADEALARGKELLEQGKQAQAREYLTHAFETAPNSATGREALLLVADSHFQQGREDQYIRAEAKYRDFLNRFPTSDRSAYVQFQIAESLAMRMGKPDRDQSGTIKALEEFDLFLRLYPTSQYAETARREMDRLRDNLAEHEFRVARFYFRAGLTDAAVKRLQHVLDDFPTYPERDKALFYLGAAYRKGKKLEEARVAFERLRQEYADSEYIAKIPKTKQG